ncbi:hypothetical protein ACOSQ3_012586 [Xanthoceras sorbifolium]
MESKGSSSLGPNIWWKRLWSLPLPCKIKFFLWKLGLNILPTKENLRRRKILLVDSCPRCENEVESIDHALWGLCCPVYCYGLVPLELKELFYPWW